MIIRVQYQNGTHDIVGSDCLQRLIESGKVKQYYNYAEKKWLPVCCDSVRKKLISKTPEIEGPDTVEAPISAQDIRKLRQLFVFTSSLKISSAESLRAADPIIFIPDEESISRRKRLLA